MTFSVGSLLATPTARTVSLTPGIGEDRGVTWAHVCELAEPWNWLGPGTLVMTTGIGVPRTTDEQCTYLAGMHAVGIAGLLIDAESLEVPFTPPALAYAIHIGFPVLQAAHEVRFVTIAQIVAAAQRTESTRKQVNAEQLHGALLLSELASGFVTPETATTIVSSHGVDPQFLLAVIETDDTRRTLDRVHTVFARYQVPALATIKDGQVFVLTGSDERVDRLLESMIGPDDRVGVSARFERLAELMTALRQARSALIRNHHSGKLLHFEEHPAASLFLPQDPDQLRSIADQVLGPLRTYDKQRSTELTQTLRVFLEENRSWVRAAERLFVHRQTLIARISRIEKIIDRDLSSIEDTAECWLAVQAAIGSGDLEPKEPIATVLDQGAEPLD
ncbi:MAG: PucR family transcriptional regulator [Leucobacter sp.]